MVVRSRTTDTGMGVSFAVSAVIHLTVFLLVLWISGRVTPLKVQETYYVDVVNLPVVAPQSGSPAAKAADSTPPPAAPKQPAPMTIPSPAKAAPKQAPAQKTAPGKESAESSTEFDERVAKMMQAAEAREADAALARMRERVKSQGAGRPGMPGASGKEAGSDYLAYLQSRLRDAFRETISFTSKNPEMTVRLFVDASGKISRKKTEKSSGDRAFEISVLRAIDLAAEKFPPPPGRTLFEGVFVFKREGVTQNKP